MSLTTTRFVDSRLATAWAIIESRPEFARLIIVTGATNLDATQPVARNLCAASHESGKRTAYLSAVASNFFQRSSPSDRESDYTVLSLPNDRSMRRAFDDGLRKWRPEYDVIVVDVPQFSAIAASAHVARLADGAVIALYTDRGVTQADRDLRSVLGQLNTTIFGVVCTSKALSASVERQSQVAPARRTLLPLRLQ